LGPGDSTNARFGEWLRPHALGNYSTLCSAYVVADANHANDVIRDTFVITPSLPETGWARKADIPTGPMSKRVKDGAALAYCASDQSDPSDESDSSYVYALKGNGTGEFYRYNTKFNSWTKQDSIPLIGRSGKKKGVKKGGALAAADGKVYAVKGNNSLEFWSYDPSDSSYPSDPSYPWTQLADVPPGAKGVKDGAGAAAVKVGDTSCVYLLKGGSTYEFYRFNTSSNAWNALPNAPGGASGKAYKTGSCLTSDGTDKAFLLKGNANEFYVFDVANGTWITKAQMPLIGRAGRKAKAKDGACLAYHAGLVYALKGGNTQEFWRYEVDSNRWVQGRDIPIGGGKRVKGGGAMVFADNANALFALKGNNTIEFWMYGFAAAMNYEGPRSNALASSEVRTSTFALRTFPNPFSEATLISYSLPEAGYVSLRLFDVTGKFVRQLAGGHRPAGASSFVLHRSSLSEGVYLLRLEAEGGSTALKLILK
jgi:N-acetylneuraminic acid mutarotase